MDYSLLTDELLEIMITIRNGSSHFEDVAKGEPFILHYLYEQVGREHVQPSEISNETAISSARIAAVLGSLEKKGFIIRKMDTADRRKIFVSLTEKGKDAAEKHKNMIREKFTHILKQLGEHDSSEFVRILHRLSEIKITINKEDN